MFIPVLSWQNPLIETAESPSTLIWSYLQRFCHENSITDYFKHAERPVPSKSTRQKIASWVQQAIEFDESYQSSSFSTQPTVLYYSVMNLAKATSALVTGKEPNPYHGLSTKGIPAKGKALELGIEIKQKGVAVSFARVFGCALTPTPLKSAHLKLRDLIEREICLLQGNHSIGIRTGHVIALSDGPSYSETLTYSCVDAKRGKHLRYGPMEAITLTLDSSLDQDLRRVKHGKPPIINLGARELTIMNNGAVPILGLEQHILRAWHLSFGLPGQESWTPYPVRHFILSHAFSELSRYLPEAFFLSSRGMSDTIMPIVRICMQEIARCFRNECLNAIYGRTHLIRAPWFIS